MGPLQPIYATRNGAWQFTGPIVALTGRQTQQAAELLTMLLMTQDHVTVIGDTTSGFANSAQRYNLTGGWTLELPYLATYDTDSVLNFDRGIPPDIHIPVSEADFAAGNDPVLDAALELVLR
jgi:C-terminal processing protease CtpA/Prc